MAKVKRDPNSFAIEYVKDLDATSAYQRAFNPKMKRNVAQAASSRYMALPGVKAVVQKHMDLRVKRVGFDADKVLEEIAKIAFSDVTELFDDDGRLKPISSIDPILAKAISSIEVVTKRYPGAKGEPADVEYTSKIKIWDKPKALELLGKHMKLFHDTKVEVGGTDGQPLIPENSATDLALARKVLFILDRASKKKG